MWSYSNKKLLFFIALVTYWIFFFAKSEGLIFRPLIQGYLSDFLALPLMLGVILIVLRWYTNDIHYRLNFLKILFAFVYISIAFEWILPYYKSNFHSDAWDVLAYAIGGLVFTLVQNSNRINRYRLTA